MGGSGRVEAAAQSFAADHDFGVLLSGDVPPAGGVVTPARVLALGAAGDDDDRRGDVRVPAADFQPGVFQDFQDAAGGLRAVAVRGPVSGPGVLGPLVLFGEGRTAGAVEPVIAASPVRVGESVVGFGDFPELLSGVRAAVYIRVVLLGQLAVGLLNQQHGGIRATAQQPVVVLGLGFHRTAPLSGGSCAST